MTRRPHLHTPLNLPSDTPSGDTSTEASRDGLNVDERAWTARIRLGDVAAFEAVFRTYGDALYRFVYGYLRTDAARDIVQEVFLRLWQDRDQIDGRVSVRTRLYVLARSRALDSLRRERVAARLSDAREMSEPAPTDAKLERDEQAHHLRAAIEGLPARTRQVFTLYWAHGLSYANIAAVMGVTVKTVENQLARALKTIRRQVRR